MTAAMIDPDTELKNSLRSLRQSEKYSDLVILCGDQRFNVHKAIVCPRSSFFASACRKNTFKVRVAALLIGDCLFLRISHRKARKASYH